MRTTYNLLTVFFFIVYMTIHTLNTSKRENLMNFHEKLTKIQSYLSGKSVAMNFPDTKLASSYLVDVIFGYFHLYLAHLLNLNRTTIHIDASQPPLPYLMR